MSRIRFIFLLAALPLTACSLFENRIDQAIARARENLQQKELRVLPMVVPTLDHLVKEYGLQLDLTALKNKVLQDARHDRRPFLRSIDASVVATETELKRLKGIDRITGAALYCDLYKLPPAFFPDLRKMAVSGGYNLTHATLALFMLRSKNCAVDERLFRDEVDFEVTRLSYMLKKIRPDSDLGIEAIVMLYMTRQAAHLKDSPPAIDPRWIVRILDAQDADGSWDQNDHTTVLAMWALYEARRAGTLH